MKVVGVGLVGVFIGGVLVRVGFVVVFDFDVLKSVFLDMEVVELIDKVVVGLF